MGITVLSLFDGISCGRLALERAGIKVDKYYASEIDKIAIQVSKENHLDVIHLGNVENWKDWDIKWEDVDLLIGGSPCQGFSSSGKQLNFDDPRSKLFFEYAKILKHIRSYNPSVKFFLENVKMKKEWTDVISTELGTDLIEINSSLLSAQNRVRLYWFNWNVDEIIDKNILLTDILEDNKYKNSAAIRTRPIVSEGGRKSLCLEVNDRNKSLCLVTVNLNNLVSSLPKGRYKDIKENNYDYRIYTKKEMCRLQTLPDDYIDEKYSITQVAKMLGNGWTVDVISHIFEGLKEVSQ